MIELLKGVKVLECAVLFNGDQTGRLLADMGADVIKIESPGIGDYLRNFLGQITPHNSPAHLYVNRNKRSLTLDLQSEEGKGVFFELLKEADIFVDGFAGDACERLGIGYAEQCNVKADIIYAQCTGFGASGPYAGIPTHGQMMGALGGGIPLRMCDDGLVRINGSDFSDGTVVAATNTALAAVAALNYRSRTGKGAYIDGSGADAVMATNWIFPTYRWNDDRLTDRRGMPALGVENNSAKYQFYETKDKKFLLLAAIEHKFWNNFCQAVDRQDLIIEKGAALPVDFASDGEELRRELQSIFHTRNLTEWIDIAIKSDIAIGPALQLDDLRDDPHLRTREIFYESIHPNAGPFSAVGWPAPIKDQPFEETQPAPALGEHSEAVLREVGYNGEEIYGLKSRGVI